MKGTYCILFLFSCFFFCQTVLAGEEAVKPTERTWQEFSSPEKLLDIQQFLDGGYQEAFWRQVGEVNSQFRTSPVAFGCSAYWEQIASRYLVWHLEFREYFLVDSGEGLSGDSDCYAICLVDNPKNDAFLGDMKKREFQEGVCSSTVFEIVDKINKEDLSLFNILREKSDLLIMAYDAGTNQLRADKRFLLPPGIWMVLLNHQEHHAADDIYLNKNKVPTDIETLIELDANAIADEIHTWKMFGENFLKNWKDKGLDFKPEYTVAKMCLADILLAEPLFEKDLKNKKPECLKEHSRKLFLR